MKVYRPLLQSGVSRPEGALFFVGGPLWFTHAEELGDDHESRLIAARQIPDDVLQRLVRRPLPRSGLTFDKPHVMGILNLTPDSFSDGGNFRSVNDAVNAACIMVKAGVDIIDIGGESTRPGAHSVSVEEEIRRVRSVVCELAQRLDTPLSIDTRKAEVARLAIDCGAALVNDVSGLTYDANLASLCVERKIPVCVMHSPAEPALMQERAQYDNVVLSVYAFLDARIRELETQGVSRDQVIVDPGIGFGKTLDHNLALLKNIATLHGLGCPVMVGVSRKGFIGKIGRAPKATDRGPGSIAVGLAAMAQGVQILRVHDVEATSQAVRLWRAVHN